MAPPTVGAMREQITIQQATETPDGQGGRAKTWATLATVWASVLPLRTSESLATNAVRSLVQYVVTVWYRTDVTAGMRLVWGSKTLQIEGVSDPDGRRARLVLDCVEGA